MLFGHEGHVSLDRHPSGHPVVAGGTHVYRSACVIQSAPSPSVYIDRLHSPNMGCEGGDVIDNCLTIVSGLVAAHLSASNDPPPGASRAPREPAQVRLVAGAVPGMYEAHHLFHHQAT